MEQLGALDNANPQHMSGIILIYVNSPSNCVALSKFYSAFGVDECDSFLSTLEWRIVAPEGSPPWIARLIDWRPFDTVSALWTLPASVAKRINEVVAGDDTGSERVSYGSTLKVLEEIGERYGTPSRAVRRAVRARGRNSHWACSARYSMPEWERNPSRAIQRAVRARSGNSHWAC